MKLMKNMQKMLSVLALLLVLTAFSPFMAQAHQPRTTGQGQGDGHQDDPISVPDPEVSKAYYERLDGEPAFYKIAAEAPFALYVNILVPDIPAERDRRFSVEILNESGGRVALLDGEKSEWTQFYEPFGGDAYFMGPELRMNVSEGEYTLKVFSADNQGKYVLAVGEKEAFPPSEIFNALVTVPRIKQEFFGVAFPFSLFASPMVANFLYMIIAVVAIVIGAVLFWLRRKRKA